MQLDTSLLVIFTTIIISLIAFAFGYGILTYKVTTHRSEINELKQNYKTIDAKLDDICSKLTVVETKLNSHKRD